MFFISCCAEGPGWEILKRPVHPTVCPSVCHLHHVMVVCCIVFDIDGIYIEKYPLLIGTFNMGVK